MLYNSLLEYIDTVVTECRDAGVDIQKFRRCRRDINELGSIVLAVHEFGKRHYP